MDILVLGAGAWGTALAISAGARHAVTLWARDPVQAAAMAARRENSHYLKGHRLPAGVRVAGPADGPPAALATAHELVIIATPMAGLREMLTAVAACGRPVAWLCKGFEAPATRPYGLLGHEIRAEVAPALAAGALSGPSFAQEVANGQPTALVAASDAASVRDALVAAFHSPTMRVYANEDLPGVEVGGAVKNVLAIATGLCDGLALGARAETFMGLSGLGDLVLTATGDLSRNRRVGLLLAQGHTLQQAVASLGHVAEGVYSARTVVERAGRLGVRMPIAEGVVDLLDGRVDPRQAVGALMARDPAAEGT